MKLKVATVAHDRNLMTTGIQIEQGLLNTQLLYIHYGGYRFTQYFEVETICSLPLGFLDLPCRLCPITTGLWPEITHGNVDHMENERRIKQSMVQGE